jgi:chromosome segregation ATPase
MTNLRNLLITLAVAAVVITSAFVLSSWDINNTYAPWNDDEYENCDTIPKKEKKIRDLDDVIDELNDADFKIDMEKMQRELKESMKKFDAQKFQLDMEKAMREVDFEKIKREMEQAMSKIDFGNIEKEMAKAMKEFDAVKLQKELQESIENVNWEKMKAEFDKVKEIDMKNLQLDMEKMQAELSKIGPQLEKAKVEIEKAKEEMKEYKEFVDGLEKDGLINKKEEYTIKHDNGELFINGKKASDATYNKYRTFLEKRKKFTIEKSDDDFNIDID